MIGDIWLSPGGRLVAALLPITLVLTMGVESVVVQLATLFWALFVISSILYGKGTSI